MVFGVSACSVDDNEMVSWQYGVPSAAVALTQKVDFYWQRERVGGSWVFVAGNLDSASVSSVKAGFPTGKGRAHYISPKFTETCT